MENIIILALLVPILGGAIGYVVRAKKRGQRCVGCPAGKGCSGCCSCCGK